MDCGHYSSMILGEDGKWYELSDRFTRMLPALSSPPPNAYILFYIRQDVKDVNYRTLFNMYEYHSKSSLMVRNAWQEESSLNKSATSSNAKDHSASAESEEEKKKCTIM